MQGKVICNLYSSVVVCKRPCKRENGNDWIPVADVSLPVYSWHIQFIREQYDLCNAELCIAAFFIDVKPIETTKRETV